VGSGVEFPNGVFTSITPGLMPVPANVDIGAYTLDLHYLASAPAAPGTFDGYVFTFEGAPTITDVTLDPTSTLTPRDVSFTGNSISINNADLALTPDSRVLLNVSVVPEPASEGLLVVGLGLLAMWGRRRVSMVRGK
jgi:MYXO-CTERM domain-containing protein